METRLRTCAIALLIALSLLAASCSSGSGTGGSSSADRMQAVVASVDVYAKAPQRFAIGLVFSNGTLVSFGTVDFRFLFLGTPQKTIAPQAGPEARATYIPTPGTPQGTGSSPSVTQPAQARGVYEAEGITFDPPGIWQVRATADIQGRGTQTATAAFQVASAPALPAPGQPALRTENLTLSSRDAPRAAIDSRASTDGGKIPDPELHRWTIAKALSEHRPILAVFATPVYCISRFCGPVTDAVDALWHQYANRAVFVHIEIWRNYNKQVINKAAADWLYRHGDLTEPWLFLIGANGIIQDRWSSLFNVSEVAADLQRLPVMKG